MSTNRGLAGQEWWYEADHLRKVQNGLQTSASLPNSSSTLDPAKRYKQPTSPITEGFEDPSAALMESIPSTLENNWPVIRYPHPNKPSPSTSSMLPFHPVNSQKDDQALISASFQRPGAGYVPDSRDFKWKDVQSQAISVLRLGRQMPYPQGTLEWQPFRPPFSHPSGLEQEVKLFFKPLNKRTSREVVQHALSNLGPISYLRVPFSKKKNKNLGYGFVVFENQEVSQQILEFDLKVQIDDKLVGFEKFATQKDLFKKVSEVQNIQNDSAISSFVRLDQQSVCLDQTLVNTRSVHSLSMPKPTLDGWDLEICSLKPTCAIYHQVNVPTHVGDSSQSYRFNLSCSRQTQSVAMPGELASHVSRR